MEDVVGSIGTRGVRVTMGATIDEPVRGRNVDAFDYFDLAIERMLDALKITVWHVSELGRKAERERCHDANGILSSCFHVVGIIIPLRW